MDKTGKTVTRHVKQATGSSSARLIPAPAPITSSGITLNLKQRRELVKEALCYLDQQAVPSMKKWGNAKKNLMLLPDEGLAEVTDVVRGFSDRLTTVNSDFLGHVLNRGKLMVEAARVLDVLCGDMPSDADDEANITFAIWGLGNSELLRGEDLTIPEGREPEARAHVRVVTAVADSVGLASGVIKANVLGHLYLPDGPMKEFLAEMPERADEIANIIRDREVTEPQQIRYILEGGNPALADGAL